MSLLVCRLLLTAPLRSPQTLHMRRVQATLQQPPRRSWRKGVALASSRCAPASASALFPFIRMWGMLLATLRTPRQPMAVAANGGPPVLCYAVTRVAPSALSAFSPAQVHACPCGSGHVCMGLWEGVACAALPLRFDPPCCCAALNRPLAGTCGRHAARWAARWHERGGCCAAAVTSSARSSSSPCAAAILACGRSVLIGGSCRHERWCWRATTCAGACLGPTLLQRATRHEKRRGHIRLIREAHTWYPARLPVCGWCPLSWH